MVKCVSLCEISIHREGERERETQRERESERETERERERVREREITIVSVLYYNYIHSTVRYY